MNSEDLQAAAANFPDPYRLLVRGSLASTNDELRTLALAGAPEGLVLLAEQQTAGRGRRGAAWFSPSGESLAFSILLRPVASKSLWPRYSLATGLAVAEAVESCGLQAGIKWPNDVWIGRRKVAGILVEAGADFVIIGIGLNVHTTNFPAEVAEIATSLRMESTQDFSRAEVLSAIVRKFANRSRQIDEDFPELIASVRQRCVLSGHRVSLLTSSGPRTGIIEGIADGGELLLRSASGLERIIQADEVRLMPS
jgi:BirA family transcriptional regulator, biotin operon repressor / biotin---[acetyl-CoA-carboxylase] ligase